MTYWGMEYAHRLTGKKALLPPLGLLTVAALVPREWQVRLVDMNVEPLTDADFEWADVVFVGAMQIQRISFHEVIARAHAMGKTVVVGGAYATTDPDAAGDADAIVIGESEDLMGRVCRDVEAGTLDRRYQAAERPDVTRSPVPRFDLLRIAAYHSLGVQFSRGCPFNCEFCDIIEVFGRVPRTKPPEQLLSEIEAIHSTGFRGPLFIVDDNFIGNKAAAKKMLPVLGEWMQSHDYPFDLYTEASVDLASQDKLIDQMVRAGFTSVFLGIETPSKEALVESQKRQNLHLDLLAGVEKLTRAGLEVMAGFIVGFDADDAGACERQYEFIQGAPIPWAMVGILTALPGTQLWRRLEGESRLRDDYSGDQFGRTNFVTRLPEEELVAGYARLLDDLYAPEAYFARSLRMIELLPDRRQSAFRYPLWFSVKVLVRTLFAQGLRSSYRRAYWRFLGQVLRRRPKKFLRALPLAIAAEHLVRYTREEVLPRLRQVATIAELPELVHARAPDGGTRDSAPPLVELRPGRGRRPLADPAPPA